MVCITARELRAFPLLVLLLFAHPSPGGAQEPVDMGMFARIRTEGMEHSSVGEYFGHLVDGIGPRLTGSPAFREAADWSRGLLDSLGLADARLEVFEFGRGWTLEGFTLEMTAPRYMPLIGYPSGWSPSTKGVLESAPIMLGDLNAEGLQAYAGKLGGRIVLGRPEEYRFILEDRASPPPDGRGYAGDGLGAGGPQQSARRLLQQLLRTEGVGLVLEPNRGAHGTMFVLGRDSGQSAVPTVIVAAEHYNMIARMLTAGLTVRLRAEVRSRYHEGEMNGINVLAELPGTDPALAEQVVMVGGHLDSWHAAPGATDNADHVAVIMEAARILTALGVRPRRTIRFAFWGGEEEGLLGSRAWVAEHLAGEDDAQARDDLSVYFNLDPGAGPIFGFFLEGNAGARPFFQGVLGAFSDLGAESQLTMEPIGSTDHVPFKALGLPAFTSVDSYADYDVRTHHTNMDTYERIAVEDLKQAAVVTAALLYQAAMRDERIPRSTQAGGGDPER